MSEYKKKLIEVALPLDAINAACAHEKMPGIGAHPRGLHLWWARRPLAACRAVLFASLVDDPSSHPDLFPSEDSQQAERDRLFKIIEDLVKWKNSNNEAVFAAAYEEILKSTDGKPPAVLDPFCGGGSIPLEAQRLGLEAHGSDLNPVAVLITKALIEIPPRFANKAPIHPTEEKLVVKQWKGAEGLAEDVRYYGEWMREEAFKRIGHLYPKVKLSAEQGDCEATVIAWLWTRTIKCPNPACGIQMPLVRSFALSTKKGKQAWVEPTLDAAAKRMKFTVKTGAGTIPEPSKVGRGAKFKCLACGTATKDEYIKQCGREGRMGQQLLAIVAEGKKGRVYVSPANQHEHIANAVQAVSGFEEELAYEPRAIWCTLYGLTRFRDLFTNRQLVALTTFSDLISEAREKVLKDAIAAGMQDDGKGIESGGTGATAYTDAVSVYLSCAIDRCVDFNNSLCRWVPPNEKVMNLFARQAIPMVWDYAEANIIAKVVGGFFPSVDYIADCIMTLPIKPLYFGQALQEDSAARVRDNNGILISTDPPYYDNIGYADLSDFFYVWLRKNLGQVYRQLFSTVLVPKSAELIAAPYRFEGSKSKAKDFFEIGLGRAFQSMCNEQHGDYPLTVFYAFKQSETTNGDSIDLEKPVSELRSSSGWETMLEGLLQARLSILGTWPLRSEQTERIIAAGTNALSSSIVFVCRPLTAQAKATTRRQFIADLKRELPEALKKLQHSYIAPVDLAQAAIGPGMAIFSRYSQVLEADGKRMPVRTALQLINQALDEVLQEQDSDYDADTRWAVSWFEQFGFDEGQFGAAEVLSKAKDTALSGLVDSGIVQSKGGKVRLLKSSELTENWNPDTDKRLTVWEITHYLSRYLAEGGLEKAAPLMKQLGSKAEAGQELAYRLFGICERKKWSEYAQPYNDLVMAWPDIKHAAAGIETGPKQLALEV